MKGRSRRRKKETAWFIPFMIAVIIFSFGMTYLLHSTLDISEITGAAASQGSVMDHVYKHIQNRKLDQIKLDYLGNMNTRSGIIDVIKTESKANGLDGYYHVHIAQIYLESAYFKKDAIRCEDNYEKKWGSYCDRIDNSDCSGSVYCKKDSIGGNSCQFEKSGSISYQFHRASCSYGLGQIMYPTAAIDLGFKGSAEDLLKDQISIRYSVKYLKKMLDSPKIDNVVDAVAAYNAGAGSVRKAKSKAGSDDFKDYVNKLPRPRDSAEYVSRILAYSLIFRDIDEQVTNMLKDGKRLDEIGTEDIDLDDIEDYVGEEVEEAFNYIAPKSSELPNGYTAMNPNFRITLPYSFNDYENIREDIKDMIDKCSEPNKLAACISSEVASINKENQESSRKLSWDYGFGCSNSAAQSEFNSFVESLERCSKAQNPRCGCICHNSAWDTNTYRIVKSGPDTIVSSKIGSIEYSAKIEGIVPKQDMEISKSILASRMSDGNPSCIGINEKNQFDYTGAVPGCKKPYKSTYRFCISAPNEYTIYDSKINEYAKEKIIYRFAIEFSSGSVKPVAYGSIYPYDDENLIVAGSGDKGITTIVAEVD